jgi:hypothetical protein
MTQEVTGKGSLGLLKDVRYTDVKELEGRKPAPEKDLEIPNQ